MKYFPLRFTLLDKVHDSALLSEMGSIERGDLSPLPGVESFGFDFKQIL
jgi:hypothetical protein